MGKVYPRKKNVSKKYKNTDTLLRYATFWNMTKFLGRSFQQGD